MEILKSLIASNGLMIFLYVLDAVLVLAAIGLFIWYTVKSKNPNGAKKKKSTKVDGSATKIDDDTYLLEGEAEEQVEPEIVEQDNAVEHFVNQISDFGEDLDQEMKDSAVIVNHPVEQPVKKIVKKEEIQNYVKVDGVHKTKTGEEKQRSFNRGSNAYMNSTNFFKTIKEEQTESKKPAAAKKTAAKKD